MLFQEEGDEILSAIVANPNASPEVKKFCISIMELLRMEGLVRDGNNVTQPSFDELTSQILDNELFA